MPLIDDRGRLFGRLNLIDAAVLLVVAVLIPMAYGAYLLFRPPPARIVALEPTRVQEGTPDVNVRGQNLRPFLRVVVGTEPATFLFADSDGGVLRLPPLRAGVYDVVLLDEETELMRLRGGLVVESPQPALPLQTSAIWAVGRLVALDRAQAEVVSDSLPRLLERMQPRWGHVLGMQRLTAKTDNPLALALPVFDARYTVRAVIQFRCAVEGVQCMVENVPLGPGAIIPLPLDSTTMSFRVEELHPVYTTNVAVVLQNNLMREEVVSLQTWSREKRDDFPALAALRPSLISFDVRDGPNGQLTTMMKMRVPVAQTARGWLHEARLIRIGEGFSIERPPYVLSGRVVQIERVVGDPAATR